MQFEWIPYYIVSLLICVRSSISNKEPVCEVCPQEPPLQPPTPPVSASALATACGAALLQLQPPQG